MKIFKMLAVPAVLAHLLMGSSALATPLGTSYTYTLNIAQSSAGLPTGPFGTVTLTQFLDKIAVNVDLADDYLFANSGAGKVFGFNLDAGFTDASVTLDAATAKYFRAQSGSFNMTPYGLFTNALDFKASVGGGLSDAIGIPLNFSVAKTGISLDDFITSAARNKGQPGGYTFAMDVGYGPSGNTGIVAVTTGYTTGETPTGPNEVPEPASLALLGLGVAGLVCARRKRYSASA